MTSTITLSKSEATDDTAEKPFPKLIEASITLEREGSLTASMRTSVHVHRVHAVMCIALNASNVEITSVTTGSPFVHLLIKDPENPEWCLETLQSNFKIQRICSVRDFEGSMTDGTVVFLWFS